MALCFFFLVRGLLLSAVRFQIEREHVRENRVHGAGLISKGQCRLMTRAFRKNVRRKPCSKPTSRHARGNWTMGGKETPTKVGPGLGMEQKSQMKQPSAIGHGNCLCPAQNIELFENSLNMAFDGDFSNGHRRADEFVGSAF